MSSEVGSPPAVTEISESVGRVCLANTSLLGIIDRHLAPWGQVPSYMALCLQRNKWYTIEGQVTE